MEINKSHFGTMTNIIIDAAYALRSRFHLPLLHINLRLIFLAAMKRILRTNFGTNNMVFNLIYIFVYFIRLLAKPVDS
jgi:hypothetical protein